MKIKSITLQNYKQFIEPKTISFCNPEGKINNKTLLVGKNGAGKTTILQAIVMLLASVTRENFTPESLDWEGFQYRHLQTGGLPLVAQATIAFDQDERQATIEYAQANNLSVIPSDNEEIVLKLNNLTNFVLTQPRGERSAFQFRGHQYAQILSKRTPDKRLLFERVGNIYWYTEARTSMSMSKLADDEKGEMDNIRNFLANAYSFHRALEDGRIQMKEGMFDFYAKLEDLYKKVFPNRAFEGARPRFDIFEKAKAPDFFLSCDGKQYELGEMSAGERAIFPILMDFARWNINNSIIIIDEIELHLHPPLQQGFVRVLEKLGNNNQFILTTHSNNVGIFFKETENQIIFL